LVGLAEDQLRAGTGVRLDVTRAHTQEVAARGALQMARSQEARSAIDLARALGLDPATLLAAADTLDDALGASDVPEDPAAAVALALQRRPEMLVEHAKLAKARAEQSAISAERLPTIDFSADYGMSGMHASDAIPTRQVMLEASLPLFDGFRREGRVAEQGAVAREAEVRGKDLEHQVAAEVRAALLDLGSGREQEAVALERMRLAGDEIAQARERFASGVAGNIEVIDAQASLFRARDALIDARAAVVNARVALARAAGTARTLH
jgi:outer membrane protein TolC